MNDPGKRYTKQNYILRLVKIFVKPVILVASILLSALKANAFNHSCTRDSDNYYLYNPEGKRVSPGMKTESDCMALAQLMEHPTKSLQPHSGGLQYFDIRGPNENIGFPQKACGVPTYNYHLAKSEDGYIVDECAPDTLYSWGGPEKAKWFRDHLGDGSEWPSLLPRTLYTVASAAATFGYGIMPLRFKIKNGIRFKLLVNPPANTCEGFVSRGIVSNHGELRNTIFTRLEIKENGWSFMEHIICSPEVIDSWSYGYTYHYDEILADHEWMTSKHFYLWEGFSKDSGKDRYLDANIDKYKYDTDYSISAFKERMSLMKAVGAARLGYLATEKGPSYQAKRYNHFMTSRPIYFNPQ